VVALTPKQLPNRQDCYSLERMKLSNSLTIICSIVNTSKQPLK
jgi:hypothetical protein